MLSKGNIQLLFAGDNEYLLLMQIKPDGRPFKFLVNRKGVPIYDVDIINNFLKKYMF